MLNGFPPIVLILSVVLAGCTHTAYRDDRDDLEQGAVAEIERLTAKLHDNDENVIFSSRVHFFLSRWENVLFGEAECEGASDYCNNDVLLITNKNIVISENYAEVPGSCFLPDQESAILRPNRIYTYKISDIENIESLKCRCDSPTANEKKTPSTFLVNVQTNEGLKERFYITVSPYKLPAGFWAAASNAEEIEAVHEALNRYREIPYVEPMGACPRAPTNTISPDTEYCPWLHHTWKHGPVYKCDLGARPTGKKWSIGYSPWALYYKTGKERSGWMPWFYTPHQWLGPYHTTQFHPDCPDDMDLWSSDKDVARTLSDANKNHVLYLGDNRADKNKTYTLPCFHKYQGSVSIKEFVITDCEQKWYRVGGRSTGPCKDMNGLKVRRYTVGRDNCYLYDKVEGLKTIDEHYNRK